MRSFHFMALFALLLPAIPAFSQSSPDISYYSRLNTFGVFGEYSGDSSHILLGETQNRKLLDFGVVYNRRVLLNRFLDAQYMAEIRPVILESDPLFGETTTITSPPPAITFPTDYVAWSQACQPSSFTFSFANNGVTYSHTTTITCGRRQWTFGEGFSPAGFKLNFLPRRRMQPVFTTIAGYMFSTRPIPVSQAGSANFIFAFGGGLEFYRTSTRSMRVEYRYHHISNADSAQENPGIDNQLVQITYSFGR